MFRFAIEKPVILTVGILIICLFGILSIFRVPIQMIPDLDARVISVETSWPGATPQDVEKELIIEQEEFLRRIPGLERMTSSASTGRAEIELEFPHGIDINEALIRTNNALSQVPNYPENVDEPRISTNSASDNPFMFFNIIPLPGNPKNVDLILEQDFIDDHVRTRLEQVTGVSDVGATGGASRQIRIYVDPAKLAERGIRLIDVRNAIRARNRDVSGGDLDNGKRRYLLRTVGRFDDLKAIEDLVVARRDNAFVRLRDVGYAELSHTEVRNYAFVRSQPMIGMRLKKQIGANVVEVKQGVLEAVEELNNGILAERGLELSLGSDDVVYVVEAVNVVQRNLLIGGALAILVLFVFLRSGSATMVGAIGLPVCTIAAFLGLLMTERTINVISLAGVAFAIGMTLDNSIVVLENIYRHMAMGKQRMQAALDGVREVWPAVLASTLTTIFVFLPVIFIEEEAGQLYSDIAVAISASIIMSMIVATTLIPAACSRFLTPPSNSAAELRTHKFGSAFSKTVIGFVGWLLQSTARRLVVIGSTLTLALGIILFLTPRAEYLPEGEESKIFAMMFAPPGYNIDSMRNLYYQLDKNFGPHFGADPELYASGQTDIPGINANVSFVSAGRVFYLVEAADRSQTDDLMRIASSKIRETPGVIGFASRGSIFSSNSGGSRSINVDISGPELEGLFESSFKAFIKARTVFENPQVRPDPSNLTMGQPLLEIRPDWERAAELGIDTSALGYTVWAYSDGAFVDEFFLSDEKIDMFLYSTQGTIDQPRDIDHVMLYSNQGGMVPLSSVASVNETVNTETIRRVDGERTVTLRIVPPRTVPLETGVEVVEREIVKGLKASGEIPPHAQGRVYSMEPDLFIGGNVL
ncbi:MAG: efflux RND transporter permease subunit, partial [Pseudomonadota bacterium]